MFGGVPGRFQEKTGCRQVLLLAQDSETGGLKVLFWK
jgi:hypothetical protein